MLELRYCNDVSRFDKHNNTLGTKSGRPDRIRYVQSGVSEDKQAAQFIGEFLTIGRQWPAILKPGLR
jgi:hypothetical protein